MNWFIEGSIAAKSGSPARSSNITLKTMQTLFTIEDVFDIAGRGCVLVPGIPYSLGLDAKPGQALLIVSPEGARMQTRIAAFEMVNNRRRPLEFAAFAVPREVKKQDLKIGSVVYLLGEGDA